MSSRIHLKVLELYKKYLNTSNIYLALEHLQESLVYLSQISLDKLKPIIYQEIVQEFIQVNYINQNFPEINNLPENIINLLVNKKSFSYLYKSWIHEKEYQKIICFYEKNNSIKDKNLIKIIISSYYLNNQNIEGYNLLKKYFPNQREIGNKVSFCYITKNSEEYLIKSIESIKGIADEIIVLDTGSNDKTIEIAKEYTKKIFQEEWQDDFSLARNLVLRKAKFDWVFMIDSDQVFDEKSSLEIKTLVKDPFALGYYINIIDHNNNQAKYLRLFRNNMNIKYQGIIHEQIFMSINKVLENNPNLSIKNSNIKLLEYGYQDDKLGLKTKRNIFFLNKALNKNNSEELTIYYKLKLAQELFSIDQDKSKKIIYEIYQDLKKGNFNKMNFIEEIYELLINFVSKEKKISLCIEGLKFKPNSITLNYLMANFLKSENERERSKHLFKKVVFLLKNNDSINPVNYQEILNNSIKHLGKI